MSPNLKGVLREDKHGWRSFHDMLGNFLTKVEFVKLFSLNYFKANISPLANNSIYSDMVKPKNIKEFIKKKEKEDALKTGDQTDIRSVEGYARSSYVLKAEKQSQ